MKYKIEKKVPIPPLHTAKPIEYPFEYMKVGDSFLIPDTPENAAKISSFPYTAARKMGMKITRRRVDEGWRFWRVE